MENIDKVKCVLIDFEQNEKTLDEAANEILRLFSVVGRSESFVCGHPPNVTYLNEGVWHCEKCGGKWNSLANK